MAAIFYLINSVRTQMIKTTTPLVKGAITGLLMVVTSMILIAANIAAKSPLQYLVFALYAAGIAWTLLAYSRSGNYTPKFSAIFGQGFRCFIIVTLIIVVFRGIYIYLHPEIAEEGARLYKEDLIRQGDKQLPEIETIVAAAKKQFAAAEISLTIFGTLLSGAAFTVAGAFLLLMRKR